MKISKIRKLFPLCRQYTYLDTASLALKPILLLKKFKLFLKKGSFSDRSATADSTLHKYVNDIRLRVAEFFSANYENIVFTSGTTESLNLLASMLESSLQSTDEIVISVFNHSSNIIPWLKVANSVGAKVIMSLNPLKDISCRTKIVALSQKSNNFEPNFDMELIYLKCQENNCFLINDAAQAANQEYVSLKNCDAIVASANKLYGPTGLGFLVVKEGLAKLLKPVKYGGSNVVSLEKNLHWETFGHLYQKLEAGTLNLSAIYCCAVSLDLIDSLGFEAIQNHIRTLVKYTHTLLLRIPGIKIHTTLKESNVIFSVQGVPADDVARYLAKNKCIVRSGDFCAKYLANLKDFKQNYLRVSFGIYNTKSDIARLAILLTKADYCNEF